MVFEGIWMRCPKIQQSLSLQTLRTMMQLSQCDVAVHFCTFQAYLERGKVNLRFPSLFFVEWKSINGKNAVSMVGRRRAINSLIELNETLIFTTEMLFHRAQRQYLKKESLIHLNLISNSRPDQIKLVGRVVVDLSEIANTHRYSTVSTAKLMYCSVDAEIAFSMKLTRSIESNIQLNELDRSSFSDLYSFTTSLKNTPRIKERKESMSDKKVDDERKKIKNRFTEREDIPVDVPKDIFRQAKIENILIKDVHQQSNQERSLPNSLPLTEKKPPIPLDSELPIQPPRPAIPVQVQKPIIISQFDATIQRQRDSLEGQLKQHKNRIRKLESDIKEVLRLFELSQQNSQLNKSKLIQSQEMINGFRETQAKVKQYYERQITSIKQANIRQLDLLRSGYEADIKILQATIEQQRLKTSQQQQNSHKIIQDYQTILKQNEDLKVLLKDQQQKFSKQLTQIKQHNMNFHSAKESILASIDQKQSQLNRLQQDNNRLKQQIQNFTKNQGSQAQLLKNEVVAKNTEIETLKAQINTTINQISNDLKSKSTELFEYKQEAQAKLEQTIFQYQHKILQSTQQLEKLKAENSKLREELNNRPKQVALKNQINPNDTVSLENYQRLRQQHNKLTTMLQTLKKSIIFPEEELRLYQLAQNNKPDLFVIMERSQLQEIQISELKQQNATMREKMGQLVEEHEQLKNSRSKEEAQAKPVIDELQSQELNLVKEQLANSKDSQAALLENQKKLQEKINSLNRQLVSSRAQRDALKQENQRAILQIKNLKGEKQMHLMSFNSSQDYMGITLKPQEAIKIQGQRSNINIELKKKPQSETVRLNIEIDRLQSLEDVNYEAQIEHQRPDFVFDEHLTHEQLNKISELHVNPDDEINYLRIENNKLKDEIEELKLIKQSSAQNAIQHPDNSLKMVELQNKLKKVQEENQSFKSFMSIVNVPKQQPQIKEELSHKLLILEEELQQSKRIIAQLQSQLTELHIKNEGQGQAITGHQQKQNTHIKQLEVKLVNLQQELKIKDDILIDGQRTIEQNYAMKYELAELKERYSEIKSALDERDEMINYLQETKEQLSKELEQVVDKSHQSAFHIEIKDVKQEFMSTPTFEVQHQTHKQLNGEAQDLKKQLISLNNNNIELRSHLQEFANQKLAMERMHQQNANKLMEIQEQKRQLQAQVNDLSLLINASSQQPDKLSVTEQREIQKVEGEMKKLSDQVHQLRANYSDLVGQSGIKQEKIATLQRINQQAKQKIEELTLMMQKIKQQQDHQFIKDLPQVRIYEIESFNEAPSLEYQHSVIPLQDQSSLKANDPAPILPPPDSQHFHVVIESLQEKIDKLTNQLNKQASQKDIYYNNLQVSNNRILDLQVQVVTMKEQIDKLNSLPIQSFAVSSAKNRHQYETSPKNMRETSIMYQPRVRGEASMSQASTPQKNNFEKGEFSKDAQTRVQTKMQTKMIKESDAELLQQELDMLKEQLESQAKLHHELREIHGMCEKKYELLNHHHENGLQQLELFKNQNEGHTKEKQNMAQQIYLMKEELQRMQAQHEQINDQYAKFLKINQNAEAIAGPSQNQEEMLRQSMGPKLFLQFRQSSSKHSMQERSQFAKKQQEFLTSRQGYQKTIADLKKNEQKLIGKINLLEENIFSMQKALQQQIQINQANYKIAQKLEQLNQLQSMASHFQKQLGNGKSIRQQLELLKEQNSLLIKQKEQLMKALQEHALCEEQRAEWQQKLHSIEHMLMNNESKFAEQKQELQNKVLILNEQKTHLQAQRTIIYENIKKGSQIMIIDHPTQQKENELYAELQAVRNEKLSQMQKLVDLEAKFNQETEQKVKKVAQLEEVLISKDHEIQQSKFVNIQLLREIEEIKVQYAEKDLQDNNKNSEIIRITQQNTAITQEITKLKEKIQQSLDILHKKDLQIKNFQQQIVFLSANSTNNEQFANISGQIGALREEISLKIASIEALENKVKENQSQMNNLKSQLLSKVESLRSCEQKLQATVQVIQKTANENNQLLKIKAQLQKQVQILNGRYSELEKAVKNTATSKDKNTELLKGQISKRDQQISQLSKKIKSKQADIINLNKQLDNWKNSSQKNELKIQQLTQKQKLMKQTMQIIEKEAQKVVQSLKSRYESQEVYYKKFIQKERENNRINLALTSAKEEIANKQRALLFEQQKLSKLQGDIELLKKSSLGQEIPSKIVAIQYEKYEKLMQKNDQLMNKNRQYLQIISQKTTANLESERLKNEIRQFQQKLDENQQASFMAQQIIQTKLPRLQKELESANNQKQQLIQIVSSLRKSIQHAKQQIIHNSHKSIENLLQQKDKQINLLKQSFIKKGQQPEQALSLMEEQADSSISILNQQILNLNREILEKDNQLQKIKADMRKSKSQVVGAQATIASSVIDEERQKLINEIQERERRQQQYKENIKGLKEQLKKEKSSAGSPQKTNRDAHGNNIENIQVISHDLHSLCEQIKNLCQKRSSSDESDKLFQTFVQKYDLMEEQFNNLNAETSVIQQKAKFISKQLQKVKSFIIKGQNRAFKEKTQLLALIKPCEIAASELVNISETLSEKQSQNFI